MKPDEIMRFALAAFVVIGFSVVAIMWFYAPAERGSANRDVIMQIIGSLCTGYGIVLGYFFPRKGE